MASSSNLYIFIYSTWPQENFSLRIYDLRIAATWTEIPRSLLPLWLWNFSISVAVKIFWRWQPRSATLLMYAMELCWYCLITDANPFAHIRLGCGSYIFPRNSSYTKLAGIIFGFRSWFMEVAHRVAESESFYEKTYVCFILLVESSMNYIVNVFLGCCAAASNWMLFSVRATKRSQMIKGIICEINLRQLWHALVNCLICYEFEPTMLSVLTVHICSESHRMLSAVHKVCYISKRISHSITN